jgi:hypothetical protein
MGGLHKDTSQLGPPRLAVEWPFLFQSSVARLYWLVTPKGSLMPIQSVEFWEEKAWLAQEEAKTMSTPAAKAAMLQIAELYLKLAEQTRKLKDLTR